MRLNIYYLAAAILSFTLPLEISCAQEQTLKCKDVEINSAGTYCLDSTRLVGVAPGSGGLGSVANYVRISPPTRAGESFDDVSNIILMANVQPSVAPRCQVGESASSLSCLMSVVGTKLNIIVTFSSTATREQGRFEERTKIVALDVSAHVIKQVNK